MMPLHRRHVAGTSKDDPSPSPSSSSPSDNDIREGSGKTKDDFLTTGNLPEPSRSVVFLGLVALEVAAQLATIGAARIQSAGHLISVSLSTFVATLPMLLTLAVGLGFSGNSAKDLPHQRYIPLTVAMTIFASQLPIFISYAMAASGIVLFGLSCRPLEEDNATKKSDSNSNVEAETKGKNQSQPKKKEMSGQLKAVFSVFLVIAVLLTENFFIWVVSATYKPSQNIATLPDPLQDNGQISLLYLFHDLLKITKREVVKVRNIINVEAILVSGLALSLVAIELQGASMQRNLWSMAMRGVLTLAAARSIRTFSFLITVVPSQNPRCYFSHFPMPPNDWISWLKVGLIPQIDGGCNDLIISGHATVTSTIACVITSIVGKPLFTTAIWISVTLDYFVEIYEGFHYSVDMFLGAMLVNFLWSVLSPIEDIKHGDPPMEQRHFLPLHDATSSDVLRYSIPAIGLWAQLVIIPHAYGLYSCVLYTVVVVYQISRFGFQQYSQHCLFCLLFMTLGLFL
mmetsp:Transcript_6967/g.14823  ORF Transcript_6967/g.14823 Transcript_6967/m.14823 type:complete len:513 (-) Transcript_6967:2705-4243(-)